MRRPRNTAPTIADVDSGRYDADFLIGPYRQLLLAHAVDDELRGRAASGGVITELLASLLESGEIDAVLSVGFNSDEPVVPQYMVSRSREELLARTGSVYSYISPRELLRVMKETAQERVAVVCQPCMVGMVRQQQRQDDRAHGPRIRYIISFFCGYNMTAQATTYLLGKARVLPQDVAWIRYRHGAYPGGFCVRAKDGREVCFGKESYELVNLQFLRGGCSRCSLYMGDGADISCGDAWLREHRNMTAILVRTDAGQDMLEVAGDRLRQYELPEKTLLHMHLHNIVYKKYGNPRFVRWLTLFFRDVLPKPLAPFKLLSRLSRWRRKRKIGVSLPELVPVSTPEQEQDRA